MKDAGMRIRVEPDLRAAFVEVCRAQDVSAAQVLRAFMRDYIEHRKTFSTQGKLFESIESIYSDQRVKEVRE